MCDDLPLISEIEVQKRTICTCGKPRTDLEDRMCVRLVNSGKYKAFLIRFYCDTCSK